MRKGKKEIFYVEYFEREKEEVWELKKMVMEVKGGEDFSQRAADWT